MEGCRKYWFEYIVTMAVNMMSVTAAVGLVWTNPFLPKLKSDNPYPLQKPLDHFGESFVASAMSVGIFCSTTTSGFVADKFGRKNTLMVYALPMIAADVLFFFAKDMYTMIAARFLVGVSVGAVWTVTPMYTAEIATLENRGFISILLVVMSCGAQMIFYSIAPFCEIWVVAIITFACTACFLVLCLLIVPESPYYYVVCKKVEKAERSLVKLRRTDDVKGELGEIIKNVEAAKVKKSHDESWTEIFKSKAVFKSLLIVMGLLFFSQNTGAVPFSLFQQDIFNATKSKLRGDICVIIVTVVQFIALLCVSKIIDAVPRKVLLLISICGIIVSMIPVAGYFYCQSMGFDMKPYYWLPLLCIISYNMFQNVGSGPMPFIIGGEIFPTNHLRTYLNGIAFTGFIIIGFCYSFFPTIIHYVGMANTIVFFIIVTCISIPFVIFCIPETKGKTFQEIQDLING